MNKQSGQTLPNLLSVSQVTRKKSQQFIRARVYSNYLSIVLSCTSALLPLHISWFIILLSGLTQVVSLILRNRAKTFHDLSREAQRRALLENSFSKNIDDFDVTELYAKVGEKLLHEAKSYNFGGDYYSSTSSSGYRRFKENIQESCFFSRSLIDMEKKRIGVKATLMLISLVLIAFILLICDFKPYPEFDYQNFRYIIGGMTIVIFFILNDDYETYSSCVASSRLFKEVDNRLNSIESIEELFSSFADYSVAALHSPPIPTPLYNKRRDMLNSLWLQIRTNSINSNSNSFFNKIDSQQELNDKKPVLQESIDINWVAKELNSKLLHSSRNHSHQISPLEGWSGNPVYEIKLFDNSREAFQLIVKFYKGKDELKREIDFIKKLNQIGTDLLCYVLLEETFVEKNILVFYHATHQTQEKMAPIGDYLHSIINNTNEISSFTRRLSDFIASVTATLDKVDSEYKIVSFKDYVNKVKADFPPVYMLDLTGDSRFKFVNTDLLLSSNQSYPDLEVIDQLYVINPNELSTTKENGAKHDWVKVPVIVSNIYRFAEKTFIYTRLKDDICNTPYFLYQRGDLLS